MSVARRQVALSQAQRSEMISHAIAAGAREACGLVAYNDEGEVAKVYCLSNVHPDPARFLIDPAEHFATIRNAESSGSTIRAVFHSHPRGPAGPSSTDLAADLDPDWVSFIVSPSGDGWQVRAFSIRRGQATSLSVVEAAVDSSLA